MTIPDQRARPAAGIDSVQVSVDGIPFSALVARSPEPRGVLVAVHGGAVRAGYFHGTAHPDQSLLSIALAAGYTVVAADRPGYGASSGLIAGMPGPEKAELYAAAVDRILGPDPRGAGSVLVAHSVGSYLAALVAAGPAADLLQVRGLELCGNAIRFRQGALDSRPVLDRFWGSPDMSPPDARAAARRIIVANPPDEIADGATWRDAYPTIAARVTVPVRLTLGSNEALWSTEPEHMAELAAFYTAAPSVEVHLQAHAPHNVSLSWAARAYHLGVLAFAEECLLRARLADR